MVIVAACRIFFMFMHLSFMSHIIRFFLQIVCNVFAFNKNCSKYNIFLQIKVQVERQWHPFPHKVRARVLKLKINIKNQEETHMHPLPHKTKMGVLKLKRTSKRQGKINMDTISHRVKARVLICKTSRKCLRETHIHPLPHKLKAMVTMLHAKVILSVWREEPPLPM